MSQSVQLRMLRQAVLDCAECATVRFRIRYIYLLYVHSIQQQKAWSDEYFFLLKQVDESDLMTKMRGPK